MAIPNVESLKLERDSLVRGGGFWLRVALEEEPNEGITRIFLLCSEGDKLPWRSGKDKYFRHRYTGVGESGDKIYRSILCGVPWGIKCPVCDLVRVFEESKENSLLVRAREIRAQDSYLSLVLDMDEVDGIKEVGIGEDGEQIWVHPLELKPSLMGDLLQILINDPKVCSYEEGIVLEIRGQYPKGNKLRARYKVDMGKKGREFEVVTLDKKLVEVVEAKLNGNEMITTLTQPDYSSEEIFDMLSLEDQEFLRREDYSIKVEKNSEGERGRKKVLEERKVVTEVKEKELASTVTITDGKEVPTLFDNARQNFRRRF